MRLEKVSSRNEPKFGLALCPGTNITVVGVALVGSPSRLSWCCNDLPNRRDESSQLSLALGAFLRRKRAQLGPARAITTTAHKLARIIYTMLNRSHFVDPGEHAYTENFRARALKSIQRKAQVLGYSLTAITIGGAVS